MKLKERKIHGQYVKHRMKSGDRKRRLRRPQNKETGKKKKENKSREDIKARKVFGGKHNPPFSVFKN